MRTSHFIIFMVSIDFEMRFFGLYILCHDSQFLLLATLHTYADNNNNNRPIIPITLVSSVETRPKWPSSSDPTIPSNIDGKGVILQHLVDCTKCMGMHWLY